MITRSQRVRAADFDAEWFKSRAIELGQEVGRYHRKIWEYAVIAQVYRERIWQLREYPPRVLGFGCGTEPLPNWFFDHGAVVTATDGPIKPAWTDTNQHASRLGNYHEVDMNSIPDDLLDGSFDFTWSCGSFEHIGGIDQSIEFFRNQMRCLKPGGIACHTTEFNFHSSRGFGGNDPTIDSSDLVLFRRRDLATLAGRLWAQGDVLWLPDFEPGTSAADHYIDIEPYDRGSFHLSLRIGGHVTTSIVLIATRGNENGDTRS